MRRIEVTASTMGQYNPSHVTLSKPYRWRGNPGWEPGHPDYREDIPRSEAAKKANKSAEAKAERFREFTRLREEDRLSVTAAARALGIGSTAARQYEAERKAALEEKTSRQIAAKVLARIAAQSPEHAALVAEYEAAQRGARHG